MGFSPSDLNSLALWVEPERAMGPSALVHTLRNSGFVGCDWANTTQYPDFETHSDLGPPGMSGDGTGFQSLITTRMSDGVQDIDHAVHHGTSTLEPDWTVFYVAAQSPDSDPANWVTVLGQTRNAPGRLCVNSRHMSADPSSHGISAYYNQTQGELSTLIDDTLPHIYEVTYSPDTGTGWIDGGSEASCTLTTTPTEYGAVDTVRLWKDKDSGREFDGTMGDLMYFNKVLDAQERGAVRGYLARKYNIQVA